MNEATSPMKRTTRFWDRNAARYARAPLADEESYRRKLRETQALFRPDMEVLEFGCGTGSTAIVHAPFVRHIRAVDFSAEMIAIARAKLAPAGVDNVTFEQAAIEDLEAPDGSYDVVMGHSILHLLEDRDAAIAKVRRLLRPGGCFVSSTVCLGDTMMALIGVVAPLGRALGLLPTLKIVKRRQLVDDIAAAGFVIETEWQPANDKAVFVIARKPGTGWAGVSRP